MRSGSVVAIVLILTVASPRAAAPPADPVPSSGTERRAEAIGRGSATYARFCSACHGPEGRGDGPGAGQLDPRPRDFTEGRFRFRSTLSGQPPRSADLESVVRRGRAGTAMPSFGGLLSEGEIADVVRFVRSLDSRGLRDAEPEALPLPEFPPPTAADLAQGRALYLAIGCWKCHGIDGSGRGPSARTLATDEGHPIRPRDFRYEPFRGGRSPQTVARAAASGLIGTPMPSHAEILVVPREAIDAVAESVPAEVRADLEPIRAHAPSAAEVVAMDDAAWNEARDRNLVHLVQYVLSLDRSERPASRLFRREPEREGREP